MLAWVRFISLLGTALILNGACSSSSPPSRPAGDAGESGHRAGSGPELGGRNGGGSGGSTSLGGSTSSGGSTGSGATGATAGTVAGAVSVGGGGHGGAPAGGAGTAGTGGSGAGTTGSGGRNGSGGRTGSGGESASGGSAGTRSSGGASGGGGAALGGGAGSAGAVASGGSSSTGGPSAGCGKTSTLTFGTVPGESGQNVGVGDGGYVTIQSSGQSRGFAMRLPDHYDKTKPYPLIFGFHWNGGTSKDVDTGGSNGYIMAHFGLQKLSNNGAIFVAPQGLGNAWPNSGGQDLKFVDDMMKLIEDNYCVDTTHVFSNGFSYGGGMTYEIACARAKLFRGVAIYEGAQLSGCDGGNDPVALWQMVGLTDTTCPLSSATPIRDRFVKNNQCTAQNPPQPPQPPPYLSPGGHVCTDYQGCSSGHPLRWCVHQSGHGNAIVDGTSDLYNSCATAPKTCSTSCPCTWVPEDVWSFFTKL